MIKTEGRQRGFGAGGRATSSRLKELAGNPHKRPIPKEPKIPRGDGVVDFEYSFQFNRYAESFYEKFVPGLRKWLKTTKADEPNLILLATFWGVLTDGKPADFWRASQQFINLSSRFGMTPADRARLITTISMPDGKPKPAEGQSSGSTLDGNWELNPPITEIQQ